ncbi:BnaC05g33040D [Brassica napus]|uniref:BnaC05g33040D protein n=1 Tax=Brassica napus TaxID=3708 RepID=A0A078GDN6_BRANA|nr:BnaC05g33040D [Brassica napus]
MDPCSFVRIIVGNLAVRFPAPSSSSSSSAPSVSGISTSSTSPPNCYCKIKFKSFPRQIVSAPVIFRTESESETRCSTVAAFFSLSKYQIKASLNKPKLSVLSVETYSRGEGVTGASCGLASASEKLLGRFEVSLDLKAAETKTCLAHNGWVALRGKRRNKTGPDPELHVSVRVEPDPRFVFQFYGEPECSPQVFQVQGNTKQAVFTCKFGARNSGSGDRNLLHSSSMMSETRSSCISSMKSEKEQPSKERKGWSVTVHDLSGSPVAMASMVTPFVPSPGSNRVTRSSPGAWLILRPDGCTWKPWGRLEAWREAGYSDSLGYRFELFQDGIATEVSASSSISLKNGGSFVIDVTGGTTTAGSTPTTSPQGSLDLGSGSSSGRGFVMSASVEGVGKQSKPEVEVGVTHVTCTEDAAAHVALAAAVDLSLDACRLFSQKLRKELRQQSQLGVV